MTDEFHRVYISDCTFHEAVDHLHNALHNIDLDY
mgnify:CR=1 FL=1|jgi:hypothetical protein